MAASSVGQIGLDLVVNQNQFNKQMSGITKLAKKAGAALAAAFAVKKVVEFGKECINLGSELAEVQNVVDVTFPHMTAQVDAFAKSAAASFGLSETMAKKFTGTFGAMAKAFGFSEKQAYDMSSTLTGLAGDVASFYNITQDEAYTKLKSVFTGETETLKDLGVVMTQNALDAYAMANGYGKVTANMTEAEKVALRYAFVQDQLSAAAGDFARTSDSWANQVRILKLNFDSLKATIGQGLINVFTPVIKVINSILSKLATLANAFKSFTELLTGNKSQSGSGVASMATDAAMASEGLSSAAGAADSLASSANGAGSAAKKAAKDMRALMGFDQINKIDEPDTDTGSSGGGGTSGGGLGSGVDFGSLAEGETVIDKTNNKLQSLIDRCKELAEIFKRGFVIGFGDSEKKIQSIKSHLKNIGKSLNEIFTDKRVINSANKLFDAIALNAGKFAGAMSSIGLTIADNLLGGFDSYLQGSSEYIKKRLISIFDVSAEISDLGGEFSTAFANIFSVFSGGNAKSITGSIIGIFSDGFLGVLDLASQFGLDVVNNIIQPFVQNQDLIKESIDNTLAPISEVLSTLHQGIKDTFDKINQVYEEHIHPMFQSFADGWSEIVGTLLEGYNEYIVPVLDSLAEKFGDVWQNHIQPTIDKVIEFIGKVADVVKVLWEQVLQPFINWLAKNIFPVIAPILEALGTGFLNLIATISDIIRSITQILGGLIDFIAGVFTGNWSRAWNGIKDIFKGIWDLLVTIIKTPINLIIGAINGLVRGVVSGINMVTGALNNLSFTVPDWVPKLGGKTFGFNIPQITAPQIPYLAQGGFVERNTPQLAMIGDNKHYGEIVAPENKMQEMVDAAVKSVKPGITRDELEAIINNAVMRIITALASVGFNLDGEQIATLQRIAQTGLDRRFNTVNITL